MMQSCSGVRSVAVFLALGLLTACGGGDDTAEPAATGGEPAAPAAPPGGGAVASADLVEQGRQVFSGPGICFTCHGQGGVGTALGPNLTDDTWIWIQNPQENLQAKLAEQIRAGTPQPREFPAPMPPMGGAALTDEQLQAVAAYVASL
jgi:mono/diheme cytochrome c family protein